MKKLLNNITSWLGWAFIEISDRVGHADGVTYVTRVTLRNKVAGRLYDAGCDLYGAFDDDE